MVGYKNEMAMGIDAEPAGWIATRQEFISRWREAERPVAVIEPHIYAEYQKMGVPMRVFFTSPRRLAVVKP